ncbi:uncharacterized protein LOC114523917 [Dendronephthya gigantea]|uniref:uncharacterized protein LOC114523917 n=1 Tax=Dendronephthya gigantea TaxID=151771 RepID=UPI001069A320|nr:uncharacterized protein LOC114523917 [Dendronephthya gigantea]
MDFNAQAYDELSKMQFNAGCQFVNRIGISLGDKVLDIGCGTGKVTKYIADIVGPDGSVTGIDPDASRIQIAAENFKDVRNLQFHVGSAATGFPHESEAFYDVHMGTNSFHWVSDDEKKVYLEKAHRSLKPGRKLAILCGEKPVGVEKSIFGPHMLTYDGYLKLFQDSGLFTDVVIKKDLHVKRFETLEEFKPWYEASRGHSFEILNKKEVQDYVITEDDGSVTCKVPSLYITASKK